MLTVRERRDLLGVPIDPLTLGETVALCMAAVEKGEFVEVGVVNAAKIVKMRADAALRDAVTGCDVIVADGQSVVWAARVLRRPLPERVAGIDLFQRLMYMAEEQGRSVYFLGAREEVLATMVSRIRAQHPRLRIAGSRNGYFADDEAPAIADAIKGSGADLLFLGMTSPKKEVFVATHGERTGAKVVHGVGGSFDVLAGVVKRAPRAWQRMGMEWLYRALQEPRRLGGRYLTTNAAFIRLVAGEWARSVRSSSSTDHK
ncbi:WecB/TagA/CpsF family glycosyltransferase [Actinoplanes sp. TBRC 11911]|uniref:WecB/TagA/CpsF family glycosyltransferase n=1 Tax=Actinoplanes sp. TBRC 11911 TaxID=2729386 RepID=UPI00145EC7B9|nr:WecB/TagA/CpsF family glycosyltransferase [Actinoplanes sp. TBRC 11911]NMO57806.1 WecB/TagA/CpsF family glycosyltransferase [Actinoplanes sp. TBRC 11911]